MKYLPLLWYGVWRKPFRTLLTFLSIGVAFLLFGLLHGVTSALDYAIAQFAANRLNVQSAEGRAPLPIAHLSRIAQVEGVTDVAALSYVQGYFGDPKNVTFAYAWSSIRGLEDSGEVSLSEEYAQAFAQTRTGAVADRRMAQKYGWKIGDQIPFTSIWRQTNGSDVWTFELVGVYDAPANSLLSDQLWIHYQYFDEARHRSRGTTDTFIVYTDAASRNAEIGAAIDALFSNSAHPTSTTDQRQLVRMGMEQAIDFNLLVKAVLGGSFFTLLLITANTMMESVRQRIPELGVLKALGYTDRGVLLLVFSEAVTLYALGCALGLVVSTAFYPLIAPVTSGAGNIIPMRWGVIFQGCLIALAAAFVSGAAPALRAQRLSVVDALRRG
ncbi:MAG: ABC transporter permease [Steroidobacteraceae bacterium]|nr:ABC transporter permease [Steroidobacteraceae bacterium]